LVGPLQKLSKSVHQMNSAVKTAETEYEKLTDPSAPIPTAPVHAARLNGLMKTLATAEGAVADRVKDRQAIIEGLEKLLQTHKADLAAEEGILRELGSRKTSIESKKQEVEVAIIRGLSLGDKEQSPLNTQAGNTLQEPDRPEVEALTPPHISDSNDTYTGSPRNGQEDPLRTVSETPGLHQQPAFPSAPGIEMLSNLASQYHAVPVNGSNKKRKIDSGDEVPDLGGDDGIDADVAEILRNDSHGNRSQFSA
jgi:regulator of Ty1 transposition protein 103